jgi:hypothetical protein
MKAFDNINQQQQEDDNAKRRQEESSSTGALGKWLFTACKTPIHEKSG